MENLVIQVDQLDSEINTVKADMIAGVYLTENQINILFKKIAIRALLNKQLVKIREGESLLSYAAYYVMICFDI